LNCSDFGYASPSFFGYMRFEKGFVSFTGCSSFFSSAITYYKIIKIGIIENTGYFLKFKFI
jgi:hypothetical protein